MRNLFDQYSQQENRLTHALAVCLDEDRKLLRDFLRWIGVRPPIRADALEIVEQGVPGDVPDSEDEVERRGLPDVVIHDDERWCVIIESKVAAALTSDQLRRHRRTLARRGFERAQMVVLTKQALLRAPPGTTARTWAGWVALEPVLDRVP